MSCRRALAVLLVGAAGLGGLAGCRNSPAVAAYVAGSQVTVDELDAAVDDRLADPDIATFAAADRVGYVRQVLSLQVDEEVYARAARRWHVAVSDADVRSELDRLLGGNDPAAAYAQVAQQQGASPEDVFETVRQQLVRQRMAVAAGKADLSDAALQTLYQQSAPQLTQVQLGVIVVPDPATAQDVLAQITADPAAYPRLAAQYAGANTLPAIEPHALGELTDVIAGPVTATAPGQGFVQAVPAAGGVVVGFVQALSTPSFTDVRDQLAQQAATAADSAGTDLVTAVRDDLEITVNPRYGTLEEGQVVELQDGVVRLLDGAGNGAQGSPAGAAGD